MAKTTTAPLAQDFRNKRVNILNASGNCGTATLDNPSNVQALVTAGAEGEAVKGLIVSNDDSARVLSFWISTDAGTTKSFLFAINIPANAGFNGTTVDVLGSTVVLGLPVDASGKPFLPLQPSAVLYVGSQTTVTAGKQVSVQAFTEDFVD
jgi:hypothetical protein